MSKQEGNMKWWQLSLFGVGCTIGTGFFLGSSIGIRLGGPAILLAFIFAGLTTYIVFDALAKMTAQDPQKGSFRSYGKKAFGHWAGFTIGWVYWASEILIMGSQLTALSIFTQFWFPNISMWIFAAIYAVLGLLVLLAGSKRLSKLENVFAIIKTAAIVMFIFIAGAFILGFIDYSSEIYLPKTINDFFPNQMLGVWSSFIFALYAFGGIEIMGLMAMELKDPKEAPKAGKVMIFTLVTIYVISLGLALLFMNSFSTEESPFVEVLNKLGLPFFTHVLNGALVIAGFSTMVASLFGVASILRSLAEDGDAPAFFAKDGRLAIPYPSLTLLVIGLLISIFMALLLPDKIYEYVTTGASLMLIYNWLFIILSARRLLKKSTVDRLKFTIGIILVLLGVSGTLFHAASRPGFLISLGFVVVIGIVTIIMSKRWKFQRRG
ncbi:amino acid permease [Salinibacillus xinjiangensis]|uniref:Amino acid permease n=1 Tax=Salinibacillus xinjiangensis TaxID=1229268 RepID=A0A6G1X634_9BACI|nr:amino acid permease [Salinibacillus xinjiangensis]MRG86366.1 amino acid permease [Salinibacillus xinjiangensis]